MNSGGNTLLLSAISENFPRPEISCCRQREISFSAHVPFSNCSTIVSVSSSGTPFLSINQITDATSARLASLKAGSRQRSIRRVGKMTRPTKTTNNARPKKIGGIHKPTEITGFLPPIIEFKLFQIKLPRMKDKKHDNKNATTKTMIG